MAMFGEPELSTELAIQERLNIVSSYLTFCTSSSILLIIYLHCIIGVYFNILFVMTNTTDTKIYIPYNNSTYDDSFSL